MISSTMLINADEIITRAFDNYENVIKLSVTDFCQVAHFTRPTFYARYGDMPHLGVELLIKKLESNFKLAENNYGKGVQDLLLYMFDDRKYLLRLYYLIKAYSQQRNGKFAARFPKLLEQAIYIKTLEYVRRRSRTGDYSVKAINDAAHVIYTIVYEWLNEGLEQNPSSVISRCQIAVAVIDDQVNKKIR